MNAGEIPRSLFYFLLAGLAEVGGGYLVWQWLREDKTVWYGLTGAFILIFYGIIPTLQPAGFGRVYAAYGGVFIILALLWSWKVDSITPDRFDLIGGSLALLGALIIMYWPRNT